MHDCMQNLSDEVAREKLYLLPAKQVNGADEADAKRRKTQPVMDEEQRTVSGEAGVAMLRKLGEDGLVQTITREIPSDNCWVCPL